MKIYQCIVRIITLLVVASTLSGCLLAVGAAGGYLIHKHYDVDLDVTERQQASANPAKVEDRSSQAAKA